jgi:hypothetical protein
MFLELLCKKGRNVNTVTGFQSSQNTFYVIQIMVKKESSRPWSYIPKGMTVSLSF